MQYVKHIPINAGIKLLCHPDASDGADNIGGIAAVQPDDNGMLLCIVARKQNHAFITGDIFAV